MKGGACLTPSAPPLPPPDFLSPVPPPRQELPCSLSILTLCPSPLKTELVFTLFASHACPKGLTKGPSLLLSSREGKRGSKRVGGKPWASLSFPCPSPNKHRAGWGAGGSLLAACLPPSLPPSARSRQPRGPCGLAPGLGTAGATLGYEPVNPSCVWTFPSSGWGGPETSPFLLLGGVPSFTFSSLYLPLPPPRSPVLN